ncbi:MAG: putative toxin-antitoxin system toxin component, PIN family [Chitinivibrionia bacterium]|nr:putative toxin-antitoxin system toxin component, PIN family [Chitinivibrionia bacterium]
MRVVIDTNIIISALFFGGLPDKFLKLVFEEKIKAVASAEIISEYIETDSEFAQKANRRIQSNTLEQIIYPIEIILPKTKVEICRDPDDDKFIACAIDGKCKCIVSGDKDLLELKSFKNVEIVTVREFMNEWTRI